MCYNRTLIKIPLFISYQQIFCQKDCQYNRSNKFDVDQSTTPNKMFCLTSRSTYRSLLINIYPILMEQYKAKKQCSCCIKLVIIVIAKQLF